MFAGHRSSADARADLLGHRIERWQEQQRRSREWISFADIADWCAREPGSIRRDDRLLAETYQQLGESLASGEFEEGGRPRVVYPEALCLASYPIRIRMARELYDACPDPKRDILECLWVPRDMARCWLEKKRAPLPPWLSSEGVEQGNGAVTPALPPTPQAVVAAKKRVSLPQKRRGPKPTVRNRATEDIVKDIRAGKRSLPELNDMKQDCLADSYGVKSRETARKALAAAAVIVANSNSAK